MADRYLVATGAHNTTAVWSATSGGASGASVPTSADDVHLDANSSAFTLTIATGATMVFRSFDCTGFTGTVTGTGTLSGGTSTAGPSNICFKLVAGMTWTFTGPWQYVGSVATAQTITMAGKTFPGQFGVVSSGSTGTLRLLDAMTTASIYSHTRGTLDLNNQTLTCDRWVCSNTVSTLAFGSSGVLAVTGTNSTVAVSVNVSMTVTGTGSINLSGAGAGYQWGTNDYSGTAVTVSITGSGLHAMTGASTFYNFSYTNTAVVTDSLTLQNNITVGHQFTVTGNSTINRALVASNTIGTARSITAAIVSLTNVDFTDITGAGAGTWSGTSVGDAQGNTGITFTTSATQYWVGGAGLWNDFANHWASSSGGAGGTGRIPLPQDDVVFDASSGTGNVQVTNPMAPRSGRNVTISSTGAIALTVNVNWVVYGTFTMTSGSVVTNTSPLILGGRGSFNVNITVSWTSPLTVDTFGGTYTLAANLSMTSTRTLTLTRGTLDAGARTLSIGGFNSNNSNTRTLLMGSSSWSLLSVTPVWDTSTTTNMTFTRGTSSITVIGTQTALVGNLTYNNWTFSANGTCRMTSVNAIFANFTYTNTAATGDSLQLTGNFTVTTLFTVNGNSLINRAFVGSDTNGTTITITAAAVSLTNVDFRDIAGAGAAAPFTGTSLGDATGNSNITFPAAVTRYWVAGSGNWSDTAHWSASSGGASGATIPLPHDSVTVDGNSGGGIFTMNMPRACKDLDCTGTSTRLSNQGFAVAIYGSIALGAAQGTTASTGSALSLLGRGSHTITCNGSTFQNPVTITSLGGTYTLADAFLGTALFTHSQGTLTTNNFNLSASSFQANGSLVRTVNGGTSTFFLSGTSSNTWGTSGQTNLTLNMSTATVSFTNTTNTFRELVAASGQVFGTVNFTSASSGCICRIGNANFTINNLNVTGGGKTLLIYITTTITIGNSLTLTGDSPSSLLTIASLTAGSVGGISAAAGKTITVSNVSLQDNTASGGASFIANGGSTRISNVTGWTLNDSFSFAGAISATGSLVKSSTHGGLAGSVSPAGALAKSVAHRGLAGSVGAAGALLRRPQPVFAGALGSQGALARQVARSFDGTLSASGDLSKTVLRALSGVSGASGSLRNLVGMALAGQMDASGELTRLPGVRVGGATESSGTLVREVSRSFVGQLASSGLLRRGVSRSLQGSIAPQGTLATTKRAVISLAGAITPAGDVVRVISRRFAGSVSTQGALSRQPQRSFGGSVGASGGLRRQMARSFAGSLGLAGVVVRRLVAIRPVRIAVSALSPRATLGNLGPVIAVSPDDPVITTAESGPMLLGPAQIAPPGGRNLTVGESGPRVSVGVADESLEQETEEVTAETSGDLAVIETDGSP